MAKLKIGIIGVGNIAQNHIASYKNNPDVELYAFCDINEERLKQNGEKHGVTRLFTDVEELVKLPELDAVSVCTWNCAHAKCTIAALNAGKHVLCEKPMAMNVEEAQAMKEAAERNGRLLMIGFVRRHGNDMTILKKFVDAGDLGDLYYAKATYLRRNGCPGGWFSDKARSGGGPLIDLGVHVIDFVRYAAGNPKPVSVYGATFHELGNRPSIVTGVAYSASDAKSGDIFNVEDLATAMIRFDNGLVLSVEASFSLNLETNKGDIELFGNKGGAKLNPQLTIYSEAHGYMTNTTFFEDTSIDFDNIFQNEINHYVDCLRNGAVCKAPAEDGYQLMRILCAIYESAETGHEVVLA